MIFKGLLYGIILIAITLLAGLLWHFIRALKDPDVQNASRLRMSVKRYRHYQRLYDEYHDFMMKHGVNSQASEKKFIEIFKRIDNPNEWRRYQAYRLEKHQEAFQKEMKAKWTL